MVRSSIPVRNREHNSVRKSRLPSQFSVPVPHVPVLHSNNTGLFSVPVVVFNTTSSVYNSLYIMTLIFIFAFVIFLTIKKCFLHICSGMARTLEMCGKYMNLFLTLKALISYRFAGKFFLFLGIFRHFNYVKSLCVSARNIYFVSSKRQAREQSI